ncbi:MAG TPA: TM0106 family RecB-like putative nuclease [Streptosporangiaceae bacterium]
MATRYDVSAVPPQGGYVAKQCPVRAQWDTIAPCEPRPDSPAVASRKHDGLVFEEEIVTALLAAHPDAGVMPGFPAAPADPADREELTRAAMTAGVPVIIGGRLPADLTGRRVGLPDVLVAAAGGGYRAVDIKHHRCLDPAPPGPGSPAALLAPLASPWLENAAGDQPFTVRRHRDDLLQLAHYQRMLEAAGFAAGDGRRYGGIIGVDSVVVWHDLDAPQLRTPAAGGGVKTRSAMAVYDFEFDFRLDIIAVAAQSRQDPAVRPLLVPVRIGECGECPWWPACEPALEAGSGDVSLLPGVGWRDWRVHRDHGITSRAELAALDHAAAVTAGGYQDRPMRALPEQIDLARAALGPAAVYRRRGVGLVTVPRGDVEVDIDMENTAAGTYLWGALVTLRGRAPATLRGAAPEGLCRAGYRGFASFEPMTAGLEAAIFAEFWDWLTGLRAAAATAGLPMRCYCYNASAENSQLRRLSAGTDRAAGVAAFIASDQWTDLYRVVTSQLITGGSLGLKRVAPIAGFGWEVDDPGGDVSMLRYAAAVHGDQAAADWLLTYNRNDTEATLALRDWLERSASDCPSIADAR